MIATRAPRLPPRPRPQPAPVGFLIAGRCGLGDNIYWRPLVRAAAATMPTWVETPYPELFADIPGVLCTAPSTRLRTQQKCIAGHRRDRTYARAARGLQRVSMKYGWRDLEAQGGTLFGVMEASLPVPVEPFVFDLPDCGPSPVVTGKPVALLRPVTERTEWLNRARNPRPEYVAEAAAILRARGYHVVLVADLEPKKEWALEPLPESDEAHLHGELPVRALLALVQHAAVVVGGVGWIVPATIAARVPLVVVCGGQGAHNAPEKFTDARMDMTRTRWLLPDFYCRCSNKAHACPKEIPDFGARFEAALQEVAA